MRYGKRTYGKEVSAVAIEARELVAPEWTLGDRLRKAREHARLEQSEIAATLGVSRAVVSKWERGSQPRNMLAMVDAWSKATGVPAAWLLGLTKMYSRDSGPFGVVEWTSDVPEEVPLPFDARDPALAVVH